MNEESQIVPHQEQKLARIGLDCLPAAIVQAGPRAATRFIEFFTATIRNKNTRAAYARAVRDFSIGARRAASPWNGSSRSPSPPTSSSSRRDRPDRQAAPGRHPDAFRLAGHRPGRALQPGRVGARPQARGQEGKTPVLTAEPRRASSGRDRHDHVVGLRDRALIAVMVYSFARVCAVADMKVEDYYAERQALVAPPAREGRQAPRGARPP